MNKVLLELLKECMILVIIAVLFFLTVMTFTDFISGAFHVFYGITILLSVQYFRVVVNDRKVIWVKPFIIRLILGIGNIALFFIMLHWMMHFVRQFEDYNYSGVGVLIKDIYPGLEAGDYTVLRSSTFFVGTSALIMIILFQFRMVYSAFKYREMPSYLQPSRDQ